MQHLSEEERALLASDPDLQALQRSLRTAREEANKAELREMQRQNDLDASIEAPLAVLRDSGRPWREWCATWRMYKEQEQLFMANVEVLCERLLWIEEKEDEMMILGVASEEGTAWEALMTLEHDKRRYLSQCNAWQETYEINYQQQWSESRKVAEIQKYAILNEPTPAEVDAAEIEELKKQLRKVSK